MGITDFTVRFQFEGKEYEFNGDDIRRNLTNGAGKRILNVRVHDKDGRTGICDLTEDWRVVSLFMK